MLRFGIFGKLFSAPLAGGIYTVVETKSGSAALAQICAFLPCAALNIVAIASVLRVIESPAKSSEISLMRMTPGPLTKPLLNDTALEEAAKKMEEAREGRRSRLLSVLSIAWEHFHLTRVFSLIGWPSIVLVSSLLVCWLVAFAINCATTVTMQKQGFAPFTTGVVLAPGCAVQYLLTKWAGIQGSTRTMKARLVAIALFVSGAGLFIAAILASIVPKYPVLTLLIALLATSAGMALMDAPAIGLMSALGHDKECGYGECITASEISVASGAALGPLVCGMFIDVSTSELDLGWLCIVLALISLSVAFLAYPLQHERLDVFSTQ